MIMPSALSSPFTNDGMMSINASHPKLKELLNPFRSEDSRFEHVSRYSYVDPSLIMDERIIDFGCRYHVLVTKIKQGKEIALNPNDSIDLRISVRVGVIGWDAVKDTAIPSLQSAFGFENVNVLSMEKFNNNDKLEGIYNVEINVNTNKIPTGHSLDSCFESLCNVRTLILGSRLMDELKKISNPTDNKTIISRDHRQMFTIPIQRHSTFQQSMVVTLTSDRVIIVIPVVVYYEPDRSLTRLFLQQFQQAQQKSSAKNLPICDFRRSNDPPLEIKSFKEKLYIDNDNLACYISFTFLENQFQTTSDQINVTQNMLMFFDFLDYHVKCSKSFIHTRMRDTHDSLLKRLYSPKLS